MKTDRARYKSTIKPSKFENAQRWGLHPARRTSAIQFALLQLFFCLFLSLSLSRSFSLAVCGPRDASIRFCFVSFFFFFLNVVKEIESRQAPGSVSNLCNGTGKEEKKKKRGTERFLLTNHNDKGSKLNGERADGSPTSLNPATSGSDRSANFVCFL